MVFSRFLDRVCGGVNNIDGTGNVRREGDFVFYEDIGNWIQGQYGLKLTVYVNLGRYLLWINTSPGSSTSFIPVITNVRLPVVVVLSSLLSGTEHTNTRCVLRLGSCFDLCTDSDRKQDRLLLKMCNSSTKLPGQYNKHLRIYIYWGHWFHDDIMKVETMFSDTGNIIDGQYGYFNVVHREILYPIVLCGRESIDDRYWNQV